MKCLVSPDLENHHLGKQIHSFAAKTLLHLQSISKKRKRRGKTKIYKLDKFGEENPLNIVNLTKALPKFAKIRRNKSYRYNQRVDSQMLKKKNNGCNRTFLREMLGSHKICCNNSCTAENTFQELTIK